jgi:hypothetical protein
LGRTAVVARLWAAIAASALASGCGSADAGRDARGEGERHYDGAGDAVVLVDHLHSSHVLVAHCDRSGRSVADTG